MLSDILFPLVFWGIIIIIGILLYRSYKKKNPQNKYFEFHGWRKVIYWLGWVNILNLAFWLVLAIYSRRYKTLSKENRREKFAYVVYYFGYVTIVVIMLVIVVSYFFPSIPAE
jgi:uncharacterized membrane protein